MHQVILGTSTQRHRLLSRSVACVVFSIAICFPTNASAQSKSYTSVTGTVVDQSGAVVPGATVKIHNPVSQFERTVTTDSSGSFSIPNVPFNPYHMAVTG